MNNIGFIEFAQGKIKFIFNAVLKCESIYLAHVLFYFIWNVVTKSRIPKNGAIRIFDHKSKLQEDAFSYSNANFQPNKTLLICDFFSLCHCTIHIALLIQKLRHGRGYLSRANYHQIARYARAHMNLWTYFWRRQPWQV
jgi:hypothetical protein